MNIESALREAISYEKSIRDLYVDAAREAGGEEARAFFDRLGQDEASHVHYLESKLEYWLDRGMLEAGDPPSVIPDPERLEAEAAKAGKPLEGRNLGGKEEALVRALKAEEKTTEFYKKLTSELPGEAARIFARFIDIEDGHTRIVQAELDLLTRTGHWFDIRDFDLEE